MEASISIPSETGPPGWEIGFGAVCVGGRGGGLRVASICSSEMCLLIGGSPAERVFSRGAGVEGALPRGATEDAFAPAGAELSGSCDFGVPGTGRLLATSLVVAIGGVVDAAMLVPGGAVAARYCFQFCAEPPAW